MSDEQDIAQVVRDFPGIYRKARQDWAVFQAADAEGGYSESDRNYILEWYAGFGRLWEGLRPNFMYAIPMALPGGEQYSELIGADADKIAMLHEIDNWVDYLDDERAGLGLAFIIIAGIILAASLASTAGIIWAVGYVKEQNNVSEVINGVAAGVLPPGAIDDIKADSGGIAGVFQSATTMMAVGAVLYFGWPYLSKVFNR